MVSVAEACKRLNESPSYFYKHSIRKLRFYKAGRATRIDDSSVDELIEQRLAENPANPQKPRQGRPRKTQSLAALTEQPAAGA
jgi:excisionase family DNA binding protein